MCHVVNGTCIGLMGYEMVLDAPHSIYICTYTHVHWSAAHPAAQFIIDLLINESMD